MRKVVPTVLAILIVAAMIGLPIRYKFWHDQQYRNFHVVEEGVLYRSAQLPLDRLERVVVDQRIRTIVCLRDGNDPADQSEEAWVKAKGLNFVRIPPRSWSAGADGGVPAEACEQAFHNVMDDPTNYPVLVHCFAGIHRTGMMCALFRMDYQGWSSLEAENEMRLMGYTMLDEHVDVLDYLARRGRRAQRQTSVTPVSRSRP